jgi:hypothetical protein
MDDAAQEESPPHERRYKAWRLANKPFILWCLTAVLLTLVPWVYGNCQNSAARDRERDVAIRQLDLEITERVEHILLVAEERPALFDCSTLAKVPIDYGSRALFPQFDARALRSLLLELEELVPGGERRQITEAIEATRSLELRGYEGDSSEVRGYLDLLRQRWTRTHARTK